MPAEPPYAGMDRIEQAPDDAVLVARARHDPRAFAPLYDRYFDPVYRYCHRRLGDHDRSAEATWPWAS